MASSSSKNLRDHLPPLQLPAGFVENGTSTAAWDPLGAFLEYAQGQRLELYSHQEEAILELYEGKNLILNTPTGSGKSLVATALHFESMGRGRRSVYTAPIKALVNEKFLALCREFGPENVGLVTGDASVNSAAPILCCTAEILANIALRQGAGAPFADAILDEFHFYSDRERGVAWQIPLLELARTRFLLLSATLGPTDSFARCLSELNGRPTHVLKSVERPVPLDFEYRETALEKTVEWLVETDRAPIYLVSFTQKECADTAQSLTSLDFCTKEEKKRVGEALAGKDFSSPYGKELSRLLRQGIGLHHAGLLPRYRVLVELLAQRGLLKIICGTDTLGVGVNVPIRTVLFTRLCKYDGQKTALLSVRDFRQIAGRAGRRGFDTRGTVVVQAPEHVIENLKIDEKIKADPAKGRKLVKRKPPEKGFVPWDRETLRRLIESESEPLASRFRVDHALVLQVLSRPAPEDGCRALRALIGRAHESETSRKHWKKTAFALFRSLVERGIIEFEAEPRPSAPPLDPVTVPATWEKTQAGTPAPRKRLRLHLDLQEDFNLTHDLALYLVDTLSLLDRASPSYALDLLSLVESIAENPEPVLRKQLDRLRTERLAELKAQGVEYEERLEELEKLEYPKPLRDFIYSTFNRFAAAHPWVGQDNIRPKSVAREMYENFHSFGDYVREYDLHRSEGTLLRYLSEVYQILLRTVPDPAKDEETRALETYLGSIVRSTDSSLLEEWERLRAPRPDTSGVPSEGRNGGKIGSPAQAGAEPDLALPFDVTRDRRSFERLVRNELHRLLRALQRSDWDGFLGGFEPPGSEDAPVWDIVKLRARLEEYRAEHSAIRLDAQARAPGRTHFADALVTQILVDPEEHNDWELRVRLDSDLSRERHRPVLFLLDLCPVESYR
jgi:superfamily II RNA helicase